MFYGIISKAHFLGVVDSFSRGGSNTQQPWAKTTEIYKHWCPHTNVSSDGLVSEYVNLA